MSVTTSTKSFRDLTRRQAVELCYVLEEQRDKALAERDALAAKVADAQRLLEQWRYESLAGHRFGASVDELQDLRTTLDASETP